MTSTTTCLPAYGQTVYIYIHTPQRHLQILTCSLIVYVMLWGAISSRSQRPYLPGARCIVAKVCIETPLRGQAVLFDVANVPLACDTSCRHKRVKQIRKDLKNRRAPNQVQCASPPVQNAIAALHELAMANMLASRAAATAIGYLCRKRQIIDRTHQFHEWHILVA